MINIYYFLLTFVCFRGINEYFPISPASGDHLSIPANLYNLNKSLVVFYTFHEFEGGSRLINCEGFVVRGEEAMRRCEGNR